MRRMTPPLFYLPREPPFKLVLPRRFFVPFVCGRRERLNYASKRLLGRRRASRYASDRDEHRRPHPNPSPNREATTGMLRNPATVRQRATLSLPVETHKQTHARLGAAFQTRPVQSRLVRSASLSLQVASYNLRVFFLHGSNKWPPGESSATQATREQKTARLLRGKQTQNSPSKRGPRPKRKWRLWKIEFAQV